jgi:hypothetical protein
MRQKTAGEQMMLTLIDLQFIAVAAAVAFVMGAIIG